MPKVSIIIPAYNRADLLPRTINSVLNQTFTDWELIVVDDGSTDNTKEVVAQFVQIDKRVRYLWQENSGGAAHPKNQAFKITSGEYLAYLDHDDEWLPTKLEKQLEVFSQADAGLGLVSCWGRFFYNNGHSGIHQLLPFKSIEDFLLDPNKFVFSNSSVLIPRTVVEHVGPRNETMKLIEDWDYFTRIVLAGYEIKYVAEPLFNYYVHGTNLSQSLKKMVLDVELFIEEYKDEFKKYPRVASIHQRHLGTYYLLLGEKSKSRAAFLRSLKIHFSLRNLITFGFSFVGRRLYAAVLKYKGRHSLSHNPD